MVMNMNSKIHRFMRMGLPGKMLSLLCLAKNINFQSLNLLSESQAIEQSGLFSKHRSSQATSLMIFFKSLFR